jgi:hypothetical protein
MTPFETSCMPSLERMGTLYGECRNPKLGLVTKVKGCKVAGQEGDPGVTSHASKSAKSVRE